MKRILATCLLLLGCESLTETEQRQPLAADLNGLAVKPTAVGTTGAGSLAATLFALHGDATMDFSFEFSGLRGNATAAHLHGPATTENTSTVLVDFAALPAGSDGTITLGGKVGTGSGMLDLRVAITSSVSGDSLHRLLDAGLVYLDVHTDSLPGGEIRGQITKR